MKDCTNRLSRNKISLQRNSKTFMMQWIKKLRLDKRKLQRMWCNKLQRKCTEGRSLPLKLRSIGKKNLSDSTMKKKQNEKKLYERKKSRIRNFRNCQRRRNQRLKMKIKRLFQMQRQNVMLWIFSSRKSDSYLSFLLSTWLSLLNEQKWISDVLTLRWISRKKLKNLLMTLRSYRNLRKLDLREKRTQKRQMT